MLDLASDAHAESELLEVTVRQQVKIVHCLNVLLLELDDLVLEFLVKSLRDTLNEHFSIVRNEPFYAIFVLNLGQSLSHQSGPIKVVWQVYDIKSLRIDPTQSAVSVQVLALRAHQMLAVVLVAVRGDVDAPMLQFYVRLVPKEGFQVVVEARSVHHEEFFVPV